METEKIIAKNIVELRKMNGKTQLDLAEALNYTYQAVSRWETNKSCPDAITLKALADYFNVTLDYFFEEHEEIKNEEKEKSIDKRKAIQTFFITFLTFVAVAGLTLIGLSAIPNMFSLLAFFIVIEGLLAFLLVFAYIFDIKRHRLLIGSLLLHNLSFIIFELFKNEITSIKWIFVCTIFLQITIIYIHNLIKKR